ncbi:cytochrome P450 [Stackebrandtia nassauensis]|uniref:Cytochrome P450 n=1 Tax=Stackebrandtia nassauensis (strain DSM 44728 / CIP 108903 / NRRL B-16338 / NBRC 102104 / LLR-40K-21) TaxID=446470 RepID=D3PZ02_STANL|nr:cytochrome P450 [Stackebrandtia nassauensis]ADD45431.1 cytochrome P450 [Stackebrandtia nassauensis DSM 44728]
MSDEPFNLVMFQRDGLDPVPELARRRAENPVSRVQYPIGPPIWLVTGYEDTRTVLGSNKFSNDFAKMTAEDDLAFLKDVNPGGLGFKDPPDHTRLRKMLTPEFTMRRLRRLIPRIEEIVAERLDAMEAAGDGVDLVDAFAVPIPSLVISELLGVPYPDRADFQRLSESRFDFLGDIEGCLAAVQDTLEYLSGLVAQQRAEPGDNLLGMLVREHGDNISDAELTEIADGILIGGHETTASMLALGALHLMTKPEHFAMVRDDDDKVVPVVDELLRYLTVVQVAFPRFALEDVKLSNGQVVRKGEVVLASLSGANRDSAFGADAEKVNIFRDMPPHVAFGYGLHRCVGAELGRIELQIAYPALLRRFPNLRLAVPFEELKFRELSIVYGVEKLPVNL